MGQITRDLHTLAGSLRLVPLARTFESMARVLRDAAQKTGRRARLAMVGEQTELDKALVDAIGDPLMHMVRNAVDHGLEATVEERRAVGKPDVGVVTLRAYQRGSKIIIEVADDGRGLDRKKILDRARARELLPAGRESDLTDREVYDLICSPGFSTAEKVSEVSGRGVGMDVVRNAVEALSGALDIDSQPGLGSTFSIRLPLTLAVMDGMVLRVAGERYILPISVIIRSVRPKPSDMTSVFGRGELLCLGERHVPVIRLGRLYGLDEQAGTVPFAVVVEAGSGGLVAVAVDEILGQQQVVIKSLGDGLGKLKTVSGGAIMSDGRVGLILDVEEIFQLSVMRHDSGVDRAQGVG
jgi:two-component system chemotaxis sensor kinase CheA